MGQDLSENQDITSMVTRSGSGLTNGQEPPRIQRMLRIGSDRVLPIRQIRAMHHCFELDGRKQVAARTEDGT